MKRLRFELAMACAWAWRLVGSAACAVSDMLQWLDARVVTLMLAATRRAGAAVSQARKISRGVPR